MFFIISTIVTPKGNMVKYCDIEDYDTKNGAPQKNKRNFHTSKEGDYLWAFETRLASHIGIINIKRNKRPQGHIYRYFEHGINTMLKQRSQREQQ